MNVWLVFDVVLVLGLAPCAWVMVRSAEPGDWVVALQMSGLIGVLALLLLAEAMSRPSFYDLAVALAILSFPAGLMFAYFIEHWL